MTTIRLEHPNANLNSFRPQLWDTCDIELPFPQVISRSTIFKFLGMCIFQTVPRNKDLNE